MILIKSADVYAPEHLGVLDILIHGGTVAAVGKNLTMETNAFETEIIEADGRIVVPGYIDQHVHVIGGGGEAGPYSRTPEVMLSDIVSAGVTTVIGVLGTDGTTRHPESLLAKVRGLETEGITAFMLTGSYELPSVSLTGDLRRDMILIDKVIGIGEVAVSDHRSSQPALDELKRIVTQARVGGMLAGKAGAVQFHMGVGRAGLEPLFRIIDETEIPARHLIPTHINRTAPLFEEGLEFAKRGGYIDITSGIRESEGFEGCITPSSAIRLCRDMGVPMNRVTMSSDGNGSMAVRDEHGNVTGLLVTKLHSLHEELRNAVVREGVSLSEALAVCTRNPAEANGLYPRKGTVRAGSDADLLILDGEYQIESVVAGGRFVVRDGTLLAKGTFE